MGFVGQRQEDQYMHDRGSRRRRERSRAESIFKEIMAENIPNLGKETDVQIQEAQRVRKKLNPKRPTLKHVIISQKLETKAFDSCQKLES